MSRMQNSNWITALRVYLLTIALGMVQHRHSAGLGILESHAGGLAAPAGDRTVAACPMDRRTVCRILAGSAARPQTRQGIPMTRIGTAASTAFGAPRRTRWAKEITFKSLHIGVLAKRSGVSTRMIRHYEEIGLIPPATRAESGYRTYGEADFATLRFIARARSLGFSLDEIADLLALWRDHARASADVKAVAKRHIDSIERKIRGLRSLHRSLGDLVRRCSDDDRPECPILDDLAGK
jgi:MerR family copper efflux transcriptional regulator